VVDTKSPATYTHLQYKMKKMQVEEERHAIIDRDNRHLLEKMSAIMRTRGRVDNWNDYQPKSLNKTKRTRELIRVTLENQKILARIQAKQPQYSAKKWEEEWMETKRFMKSVRKYSEDWYQLQEAERRSRQASKQTSRATSRRQVTREARVATADDSNEDEVDKSKPATPIKANSLEPTTPTKAATPSKPATPTKPTTPTISKVEMS